MDKIIAEKVLSAFASLEAKTGYETRAPQRDMAAYVAGCLHEREHGIVEAPTGVGKSLGALIPAIARALVYQERVIVATCTNVLAEQYWQHDLPLALSLFGAEASGLQTELVMGKTRYLCLERVYEDEAQKLPKNLLKLIDKFNGATERGTENEFASFMRKNNVTSGITRGMWGMLSTPPICKQRLCPSYNRCHYFRTRRAAENASIVITNHSVILADAELRVMTGGSSSMLAEYQTLILDEAHDFLDSVRSAFEFSLNAHSINNVIRMAMRLTNQLAAQLEKEITNQQLANSFFDTAGQFSRNFNEVALEIEHLFNDETQNLIITANPEELYLHPNIQKQTKPGKLQEVKRVAEDAKRMLEMFYSQQRKNLSEIKSEISSEAYTDAREVLNSQGWWFKKFAGGLKALSNPAGVTWIEKSRANEPSIVTTHLEFDEMLKDLLWSACPTIAMSATLAIDNSFEFFQKQTGLTENVSTLKLPSMFDYAISAALYQPEPGVIPEPPTSARSSESNGYYCAVASEIENIINCVQGRTLVLFSSRAEMEAIHERMPFDFPYQIILQGFGGFADLSNQFKEDRHSVLFGLRSFWTGFDAPGDTLSCVVLVRIPFEVPIEPSQIARGALIEIRGGNSFTDWTMPNAKQQIKQGAGRLLRRTDDRGVICLLDARLYTKRYGTAILANLPEEMPRVTSIEEAVARTGIRVE